MRACVRTYLLQGGHQQASPPRSVVLAAEIELQLARLHAHTHAAPFGVNSVRGFAGPAARLKPGASRRPGSAGTAATILG